MKKIIASFALLFVLCLPVAALADDSNSTAIVHLNTATASQLEQLKGIGPSHAKAIIEYRKTHGDFKSVEDLTKIKGIGPKAVKRLLEENPHRVEL